MFSRPPAAGAVSELSFANILPAPAAGGRLNKGFSPLFVWALSIYLFSFNACLLGRVKLEERAAPGKMPCPAGAGLVHNP